MDAHGCMREGEREASLRVLDSLHSPLHRSYQPVSVCTCIARFQLIMWVGELGDCLEHEPRTTTVPCLLRFPSVWGACVSRGRLRDAWLGVDWGFPFSSERVVPSSTLRLQHLAPLPPLHALPGLLHTRWHIPWLRPLLR